MAISTSYVNLPEGSLHYAPLRYHFVNAGCFHSAFSYPLVMKESCLEFLPVFDHWGVTNLAISVSICIWHVYIYIYIFIYYIHVPTLVKLFG